jgi:hypothetical protein
MDEAAAGVSSVVGSAGVADSLQPVTSIAAVTSAATAVRSTVASSVEPAQRRSYSPVPKGGFEASVGSSPRSEDGT